MADGCIEPVPHDLPGDVELWRVDLDLYRYDADAAIFSADERRRAERFLFEADRRRFLAAHHALRQVLGRALGREPGALVFTAGAQGKPRLLAAPALEFNLSHSVHECLIGTSARRPIGVDVEVLRSVVDADALARRHFTPSEFEQWAQAPALGRERAFLQVWTRKEACLKAVGLGLSVPPGGIEVGCETSARTVAAASGTWRDGIELVTLRLADAAIGAAALANTADPGAAGGAIVRR